MDVIFIPPLQNIIRWMPILVLVFYWYKFYINVCEIIMIFYTLFFRPLINQRFAGYLCSKCQKEAVATVTDGRQVSAIAKTANNEQANTGRTYYFLILDF